jgi:hypothetical protein
MLFGVTMFYKTYLSNFVTSAFPLKPDLLHFAVTATHLEWNNSGYFVADDTPMEKSLILILRFHNIEVGKPRSFFSACYPTGFPLLPTIHNENQYQMKNLRGRLIRLVKGSGDTQKWIDTFTSPISETRFERWVVKWSDTLKALEKRRSVGETGVSGQIDQLNRGILRDGFSSVKNS